MITLRQIEVIRAIMITGTVKGAAELLGVSSPGISRVMKHTEGQLGIRLFARVHGRYIPTNEAREIFDQISEVYQSIGNLQYAVDSLKKGGNKPISFAAVPSIASHVFPTAIQKLRARYPDLTLSLNTLKIEEAIDYLLLNKGEMVALSYKLDHPGLSMQQLYSGDLVALVPVAHPLAHLETVSVSDLSKETVIGIDPADPYGSILAAPFRDNGLPIRYDIQARTGQMIEALVAQGLGVAIIDKFSIAGPARQPGAVFRPLYEKTRFRSFAAFNAQHPRSHFAEELVRYLKSEMRQVS